MVLGNTQICGIVNISNASGHAIIRSSIQGVLQDLKIQCNELDIQNNATVNNRLKAKNAIIDNDVSVGHNITADNLSTTKDLEVKDTASIKKLNVTYASVLGGIIQLKENENNFVSYGTNDPSSAVKNPIEGQLYFKII